MNSTITIIGNLTKDPELRFTGSGMATANLNVAVNRRINGRGDGPPTETVSYFTVIVWGSLAENVCESMTKGQRVVATGRLDQRSWTTAEGEKRVTYEITAEDVGVSLRFTSATVHKVRRAAPTADEVRSVVLGPDGHDRADSMNAGDDDDVDVLVASGRSRTSTDDQPF